MKKAGKILLLWGPVVLWMGVIASFSAQTGTQSSQLSGGVLQMLLTSVFPGDTQLELVADLELLIRKLAHIAEYFLLGMLTFRAVCAHSPAQLKRILYSFGVCVAFAGIDELHQTFVPGRSGRFTDVLIDGFGALAGILFLTLCLLLVHKLRAGRRAPKK